MDPPHNCILWVSQLFGPRESIYAFLGYFNVDIYDMLFKVYFAFGRVWWSRKGPKVLVWVAALLCRFG